MITAGQANALTNAAKRYRYEIHELIDFIEKEIIISAAQNAENEITLDFDSRRYENFQKIKGYVSNPTIMFNVGVIFEEHNYKVNLLKREDGTIKGLEINWNILEVKPKSTNIENAILNSLL